MNQKLPDCAQPDSKCAENFSKGIMPSCEKCGNPTVKENLTVQQGQLREKIAIIVVASDMFFSEKISAILALFQPTIPKEAELTDDEICKYSGCAFASIQTLPRCNFADKRACCVFVSGKFNAYAATLKAIQFKDAELQPEIHEVDKGWAEDFLVYTAAMESEKVELQNRIKGLETIIAMDVKKWDHIVNNQIDKAVEAAKKETEIHDLKMFIQALKNIEPHVLLIGIRSFIAGIELRLEDIKDGK